MPCADGWWQFRIEGTAQVRRLVLTVSYPRMAPTTKNQHIERLTDMLGINACFKDVVNATAFVVAALLT